MRKYLARISWHFKQKEARVTFGQEMIRWLVFVEHLQHKITTTKIGYSAWKSRSSPHKTQKQRPFMVGKFFHHFPKPLHEWRRCFNSFVWCDWFKQAEWNFGRTTYHCLCVVKMSKKGNIKNLQINGQTNWFSFKIAYLKLWCRKQRQKRNWNYFWHSISNRFNLFVKLMQTIIQSQSNVFMLIMWCDFCVSGNSMIKYNLKWRE